jgi:hypothetical protein
VPEALRPIVLDEALRPISFLPQLADTVDVLPSPCHAGTAQAGDHLCRRGVGANCIIWPVFMAYMEAVRVVVACEERDDFRHFRTDRLAPFALRGNLPYAAGATCRRVESPSIAKPGHSDSE